MACNSECRRARGRQAHCGACHKTFAGLRVFDDHRKGGACVELTGVSEKDGIWGTWGSSAGVPWWTK